LDFAGTYAFLFKCSCIFESLKDKLDFGFMKNFNWLIDQTSPELEEEVDRKIQSLKAFEDEVPVVIIVHDVVTDSLVYMSRRGLEFLGVTLEEIRLPNHEYFPRFFNEEDANYYVPKILGLVERNNSEELISYFQQVRRSPEHPWMWHLSSTKIFLRDKEGKPRLVITIALQVDTMHPIATKVDRMLDENEFLRTNRHLFNSLTRREKEILKRMASGQSSVEIAEELFISEATANTHRRNIRKKINAVSSYDITRFAQAFNLI